MALPAVLSRPAGAVVGTAPRRHVLAGIAGIVIVVLVMESVDPFRQAQLSTMAYLGIAIGGLTVLTGLNGQLSLGHGALMAIGAYTTAVMMHDPTSPRPLLLTILVSILVTLAVGAVVGVAAARLHGPYIAGATLALAVAVPGIASFFDKALGGEQGMTVTTPAPPTWLDNGFYFLTAHDLTATSYIAYLGWVALLIAFVLLANLSTARVGRNWRAVRDDDVAAEIAGIPVGRTRVVAFVVSAGCAGLAGSLMAMVVRLAAPSGFTLTLSLSLLTAIVLGGLGSLFGAVLGAALLTFLPQAITGVGTGFGLSDVQSAELAPFVYGVLLVLIMLLAPAGLVGETRNLLRRRRRGPTPGSTSIRSLT
ncbi:MAG TPA: branched-chain amino acid ABC transporter permease [Nocardioidaceae bacterium]|nr:branched-chain amino acid ABC transporter permease [Nocardioidaceae bacterium]